MALDLQMKNPRLRRIAEIEALRKEIDALTEALKNQRWHDRKENDFKNPFAVSNHWQQGFEDHRRKEFRNH